LEPTDTGDPPPLSRARELERHLRREAINEAQQLAAELHDGLGQELAAISLLVSALRRNPQAQHPEIQEPLAKIDGLMAQAMVSCRRVSEGFGGFLVCQHGLTVALLHFASQFDDERVHVEFRGRDIPAYWLDETAAY
jgi:signal transduction histidine kinase